MIAAVNVYLKFLGKYECTVKKFKVQTGTFRSEDKELGVEEYTRLLNAARKSNDDQLLMILQTICATGIRVSELSYFTVEGVNRKTIEVRNKGKVRVIVLPNKLTCELKKYCAKYKIRTGHIFKSKTGNPISRQSVWAKMKKLCEKAGVDSKKCFPHALRYLFAKVFHGIKNNLVQLASILGHRSIETTRHYLMPSIKSCLRTLNSMGLVILGVT